MLAMDKFEVYLIFKTTMNLLKNGPVGREEIAKATGIKYHSSLYIIQLLLRHKVIKLVSYDLDCLRRRHVYGLVKNQ